MTYICHELFLHSPRILSPGTKYMHLPRSMAVSVHVRRAGGRTRRTKLALFSSISMPWKPQSLQDLSMTNSKCYYNVNN